MTVEVVPQLLREMGDIYNKTTMYGSYMVVLFSDPGRILTFNLLIRSQILYTVELRGPFRF